jgi:ketosteroid isomerase-like protein
MRAALLGLSLCAAVPTGAQQQDSSIVREIVRLEQQVNAAYARNDLPAYFGFYAPDLTQWFEEGRVDLPSYQKNWTAYINAGNRILAADYSDMNIRVSPSGDAAVASYLLRVRTRTKDGKESAEENHETDVWFRRGGSWKIVVLHYSPVKPGAS